MSIGIGIGINIPSLRLLGVTIAHHFILLVLKDTFFLCGHAVENTLDCWQSHLEPSRCTCGGILDT